jgi:sulfide:quinone oxidoreductase
MPSGISVEEMGEPAQTAATLHALIVGGGVAALEAALALRSLAADTVRVTLLAPNQRFTYRPLSVVEPFGRPLAKSYPLLRIANDIDAELVADRFAWLDHESRVVHTEQGNRVAYDALLLAPGARAHPRFPKVLTLDPGILNEQLYGVIQDVERGYVHSVAFVIPSRETWPLPVYELALMTASRAREMGVEVTIRIATPEHAPLAVFGTAVSDHIMRLLGETGIELITSAICAVRTGGLLSVHPGRPEVAVDLIVALPELFGPELPGVPRSAAHGFISVDRHGRVYTLDRVFAAGDATDFPVKHAGIAAQQADAAAESIATLADPSITPRPFSPIVEGLLLGGPQPLYLRARSFGGEGSGSEISTEPLWSPPNKIRAQYLAPYLDSLEHA